MSKVDVQFDFKEAELMIARHINENAESIAKQIAQDAQNSVGVVTGNLKRGIRARKSRFEDGGWIVVSTAPHAFLLEFGTVNMSAKPYLRPALYKNIAEAKRQFGVRD